MNIKRTNVTVTFSDGERVLCREMADFLEHLRNTLEEEKAVAISDYEGGDWELSAELNDFLIFCERVSDEKRAKQEWDFIYP